MQATAEHSHGLQHQRHLHRVARVLSSPLGALLALALTMCGQAKSTFPEAAGDAVDTFADAQLNSDSNAGTDATGPALCDCSGTMSFRKPAPPGP